MGANAPDEFMVPSPRDAPPPDPSERGAHRQVRVLGGYRIVRKLGQGGMGAVFEATQVKLGRRVALKVLLRQSHADPADLERFRREARSAAALDHPNIVHVHDIGEDLGYHFFAMELVDGESLSQRLTREGRLSVAETLDIAIPLTEALCYAAKHKIIHRDIKPGNILLTQDGQVKLADLGLAKDIRGDSNLTRTSAGIGTPYYMSPEQARDARQVDHRADIYSLGITLFHLLTGKIPFQGAGAWATVLAHAKKALPTGQEMGVPLPDAVEAVLRRMCAKKPEDRYQDYEPLLADLRMLQPQTGPAARPLTGPELQKGPPHVDGHPPVLSRLHSLLALPARPGAIAACVVVAILALAFQAYVLFGPGPARPDSAPRLLHRDGGRATQPPDHTTSTTVPAPGLRPQGSGETRAKVAAEVERVSKSERQALQTLSEEVDSAPAREPGEIKAEEVEALSRIVARVKRLVGTVTEQGRRKADELRGRIEQAAERSRQEQERAVKQYEGRVSGFLASNAGPMTWDKAVEAAHLVAEGESLSNRVTVETRKTIAQVLGRLDKRLTAFTKGAAIPRWLLTHFGLPGGGKDTHGNMPRKGYDETTGLPLEIAHKATGLSFALIPAGTFLMGSPKDEAGRRTVAVLDPEARKLVAVAKPKKTASLDLNRPERVPRDLEGPRHAVRLTKPFYMGKYELTNRDLAGVLPRVPSMFRRDDHPADSVSHLDAEQYVKKLNEKNGADLFSLPTEAQWEHACRAGTNSRFYFGEDLEESTIGRHAWHNGNSGSHSHPVGEKRPNAWGLHDMHGNVSEWCLDAFRFYPDDEEVDPTGPLDPLRQGTSPAASPWSGNHVARGGSWFDVPADCRSASRAQKSAGSRCAYIGFRIAVTW